MLLGADCSIGNEERSFDSLRSLRIRILIGFEVNRIYPHPRHFSEVWQTQGFKYLCFWMCDK